MLYSKKLRGMSGGQEKKPLQKWHPWPGYNLSENVILKRMYMYFSGIIKGKEPSRYLKIPKTGGEKREGIPYRQYRIKVYLL